MPSPIQFSPRTIFSYDKVINWFPGHMAKGLRQISERISTVDLVVEARDARIPLSSVNPAFERVIGQKDRLIVYNKADLANPNYQSRITQVFMRHNQRVLYTNANADDKVRKIIDMAAQKAREDPIRFPFVTVMVVGMPNVGKSSLINSMRRLGTGRGKAAATGAQPGVTKVMAQTIKVLENPTVYLIDTPGVMIPHISDPVTSLKVALTGGIHGHLADEEIMADYLLYKLNLLGEFGYARRYALSDNAPTNDAYQVLFPAIARRTGALLKGNEPNTNAASKVFLNDYRLGKLGRLTLDDVSTEVLENWFVKSNAVHKLSRRQLKISEKRERLEKKKRK